MKKAQPPLAMEIGLLLFSSSTDTSKKDSTESESVLQVELTTSREKKMTTTESRRLESLIEKVFRLNEEVNQKRQREQPYQRLRELEQLLRKREVEVV